MPTNDVRRALRALNARVRRASASALDAADRRIARRIAAGAPVDTGDLARSVRPEPVRATRRGIVGGVVVDDPAAAPVEFGTDTQSPQPFIRPGIAAEAPGVERRIRATLKNAL